MKWQTTPTDFESAYAGTEWAGRRYLKGGVALGTEIIRPFYLWRGETNASDKSSNNHCADRIDDVCSLFRCSVGSPNQAIRDAARRESIRSDQCDLQKRNHRDDTERILSKLWEGNIR